MTEWKTYRLGDICTLNYGKALTATNRVAGDIPVYSSAGITGNHNVALVQSKGIIVGRKGSVGTVYYSDQPFYCIDTAYYILPDDEKYDFKWLYYRLKSLHLDKLNEDSAVPGLNRETAYAQEFLLPSLEEQRRIAGILGAIDDKIENNRRTNNNLEQQAQALYKQWFVDNRKEDWEEIKLGDIIEISKKSITPVQSENTIFEHYSLPAFDDGIQPVFEKGKYIKSSKFIVEQNMFLFSKLNPRIKRIWLPDIQTENAICSTEFIPYKPKDIAMFGFCYSIVNSDSFYEYVLSLTNGSTGSHQRFHPIDTLDYELMIPNNDYIAKFEELVMPIYRTIARNRMECKNLATIRDTLLPKLMNGEIITK